MTRENQIFLFWQGRIRYSRFYKEESDISVLRRENQIFLFWQERIRYLVLQGRNRYPCFEKGRIRYLVFTREKQISLFWQGRIRYFCLNKGESDITVLTRDVTKKNNWESFLLRLEFDLIYFVNNIKHHLMLILIPFLILILKINWLRNKKWKILFSILKRNGVFATNSDFQIPTTLHLMVRIKIFVFLTPFD